MSTFKVKLTPLTPIGVSHPEPLFPVDIIPKMTAMTTPSPSLSALSLDWRFDEPPSQLDLPPTPEELSMMFSSDFPIFGLQTPRDALTFPEFELVVYDALFEPFGREEHPFALPRELEAEIWGLSQNMGESLFSKSDFILETQENRFVDSGFEEFAAFGIDFEEPPQIPSEGSSESGHGG